LQKLPLPTEIQTQFVVVEMSLKDFGLALLGRGRVDCEMQFNNLGNICKRKETKTFTIQADRVGYLPSDKLNELFLDGWNVVLSSYKNPSNYTLNPLDAAYTFTAYVEFERFV
jgi:hypothetical protein